MDFTLTSTTCDCKTTIQIKTYRNKNQYVFKLTIDELDCGFDQSSRIYFFEKLTSYNHMKNTENGSYQINFIIDNIPHGTIVAHAELEKVCVIFDKIALLSKGLNIDEPIIPETYSQ